MSIKAMVWAWAQDDLTSTEVLVLLALADHADDSGFCWPGQAGIAEKCKVSRETANRTIKSLETKAKLTVIHRKDEYQRAMSNQYLLCVKQGGTVTDDHMGRVTLTQKPCDAGSQESSEENLQRKKTSEEDLLEPSDLVEAWNEQIAPLGLSKVELLSPTRRQKAKARIREHPDTEFWSKVLGRMRASPFLLGRNGSADHKGWKANFDWLIENDTNAVKVYEGRYAKEN